jgi:ABC-2 type transport system ATP-binding protein
MPEHALVCRGVVKSFGDVRALDGLDLTVLRGECFGLLGPNGAGKTTAVEIFEGLQRADAGEVRVLGESWNGRRRDVRDRLGIQLQEALFPEKLSVRESIALFRSFYRRGLAVEDVLDLVRLREKADAWVKNLSGGQKQRLSLACALVSEPELLFLDEPTTGLDPQSRRQIWEIVADFRRRGGTVLLTTHYMEEAHKLCDRLAIIDRGRVIASGTPSQLIASLGAEHVLEFRAEGSFDALVAGERLGASAASGDDGLTRFSVSELHRAVPVLLDEVRRQGVELAELRTHHATLEDVFMSLTGRHLRDE